MYSKLPPAPPEEPVVFNANPVLDAKDRVHALESAFIVLAVTLLESDIISVDHLKRQLWDQAQDYEAGEERQKAAYLDQVVEQISAAVRARRHKTRPSGIRYQEWQERQDGRDAQQTGQTPNQPAKP